MGQQCVNQMFAEVFYRAPQLHQVYCHWLCFRPTKSVLCPGLHKASINWISSNTSQSFWVSFLKTTLILFSAWLNAFIFQRLCQTGLHYLFTIWLILATLLEFYAIEYSSCSWRDFVSQEQNLVSSVAETVYSILN